MGVIKALLHAPSRINIPQQTTSLTSFFGLYLIYFTPLSVTQGHTASKSFIIVNSELKRIWKEAAKAKFVVPSRNLYGGNDRNHTRARTVGVSDQIRTEHLKDKLTNRKY
jgi:hypothetical protein